MQKSRYKTLHTKTSTAIKIATIHHPLAMTSNSKKDCQKTGNHNSLPSNLNLHPSRFTYERFLALTRKLTDTRDSHYRVNRNHTKTKSKTNLLPAKTVTQATSIIISTPWASTQLPRKSKKRKKPKTTKGKENYRNCQEKWSNYSKITQNLELDFNFLHFTFLLSQPKI